jgi:hypothetical protein
MLCFQNDRAKRNISNTLDNILSIKDTKGARVQFEFNSRLAQVIQKTAQAFAFCGGVSIFSVHPSLDEALFVASQKGYTVKRESLNGAVLNGKTPYDQDGDNGGCYVAEIFIEPSAIFDRMWCHKNSEGFEEDGWCQSSSYFPDENWMHWV